MNLSTLLGILAAIATIGPQSARAEAPERPCQSDIQKFCKDVQPGQNRLSSCLRQHESELSQPCKQLQASIREKAQKIQNTCQDDVQQYCKNISPGQGRMMNCLRANNDKISNSCRAALSQPLEKKTG